MKNSAKNLKCILRFDIGGILGESHILGNYNTFEEANIERNNLINEILTYEEETDIYVLNKTRN